MALRAEVIEHILSEVRGRETACARKLNATWLLNGSIYDFTWKLRTKQSVKIDDQWTNFLVINWHDRLPDGSRLSDSQNNVFLRTVQELAFLIRDEAREIHSSMSFISYVSVLKALTQWIFSNSRRFSPKTSGLSRLDETAVLTFARKYISGGTFEAGEYAHRFLKMVAPVTYRRWRQDTSANQSIFQLPDYLVTEVSSWLRDKGYYRMTAGSGPTRGLLYVSRTMLCDFLQCDLTVLRNNKSSIFFRQFEPDYITKFPNLVVRRANMYRECLSHRTPTIEKAIKNKANTSVVSILVSVLQGLQHLNNEVPLSIPNFSSSFGKSPLGQLYSEAQPNGHTLWMPLEISMTYLNESLRWVIEYGRPLVDFYIEGNFHFKKKGWLCKSSHDDIALLRKCREDWFAANLPAKLQPLGLTGWQINSGAGIPLKGRFSLIQALTVLIGACTYLITNLAPSRVTEITQLEKQCLEFKQGDGFWMTKHRGKDVIHDQYGTMTVPVPRGVAHAIGLLIDLGLKSKPFSARYHEQLSKYLFYLPFSSNKTIPSMGLRSKAELSYALDQFADFVGMPPDEYGRRWYPRVHENRKSFLLTLVWAFKYAALDAARMLAGHTDINHILAYIKANFPGEEISELEADYLAQTLWDFGVSHKKNLNGVTNVETLYQRVCAHFKVREISEIAHNELKDFLDLTLSEGTYVVDVIDIVTKNGKHMVALTIRFSKAKARSLH